MALMKRFLKATADGGLAWDPTSHQFVEVERDAVAVQAKNDWLAGKAEVYTVMILLSTEDVPQFVIQLIYLMYSISGHIGSLWWLTTIATAIHLARQLIGANATWRRLPMLKKMAFARDKTFEQATDEDVLQFAKAYGPVVRIVSLARSDDMELSDSESVETESDAHITHVAVLAIAKYCPNLRAINFTGSNNVARDGAIVTLAASCSQLQSLNLESCDGIQDTDILEVAKSCTLLTSLSLGYSDISDESLKAVARSCTQLTKLSLRGCQGVKNDGIEAVAHSCTLLKWLDISYCSQLTDDGVKAVAEACSYRLVYLGVEDCSQLGDAGLEAVAQNCTNLAWLNIACGFAPNLVTDVGIKAVAQACTKLQEFYLHSCPAVTEEGVAHVRITLSSCDVIFS
jgi:hypothetical protein